MTGLNGMWRLLRGPSRVRSANSVLAIATLSHMMQHIFVGTSILFPMIIADLNLNYTEFGLAMAVSSLIGGTFQLFFSVLSRKIARYLLLGLGNILLSIGTFVTSLSYSLIHFLNGRLVSNIGVAPQHPMGTAIVTERFEGKSIGRAIGIHYGLAYIGNIIGPLFVTFLTVAIGWRNTLVILSVPALVVGLTVIWYLSGDRGSAPAGIMTDETSFKSDITTLVKTKSVIPIIMTQALISGGTDLVIITTYIPLFLADALKLDVRDRGIIYTFGLVGGVLGPILLGRYADRFGHLKTATFSISAALILVFLLSLYDSANPVLALHLFILGFASFALPTLLQIHLVKVTQGYNRDMVVGLFFTTGYIFNSLWTGVMGRLIDVYSSFKPAFILMGTLGLLAFVILAVQMRKIENSR